MVTGSVRVTDVRVIDTIRSYRNREKVWEWTSCAQHTAWGKNFELILTLKMRHPVDGPFGCEFSTFVIIVELWRPEDAIGKFLGAIFALLVKTTPYGKIFKILFVNFSPPHRSTLLCSNVVKFVWLDIREIVHYSHLKKNKISAPSQTVATAWIAPKICQGQPPTFSSQCSKFHPNWFTFGGVIAEHVNGRSFGP